ncbi:hypothetical protein [uncultured Mediterranean phage]|nr:hypothetical protein [uncultured Mediterranean phage]
MTDSPKQEEISKLKESSSPSVEKSDDQPSSTSISETSEEKIPDSSDIGLRLGDIIEINSPTNKQLDKHIFVITYCNPESQITLVDSTTLETHNLFITEGRLNDESIVDIVLLSRDENVGYARQNNLLPNTWVTINFGGDVPATITGLITNLEEDMIEIQIYPEKDVIYIDFGYKGIPKKIPINQIVIRDKPQDLDEVDVAIPSVVSKGDIISDDTQRGRDPGTMMGVDSDVESPDQIRTALPGEEHSPDASISGSMTQYDQPHEEVQKQIKEMLIDADQITFGEELDAIEQVVEVSDQEQRYGIDAQTGDLLDELLSTIPSMDRTRKVLQGINTMINRFKQLREQFSDFDAQGNATIPKKKGANFKPLVEHLDKLNQKLYWILPVVKNSKKIYDDGDDELEEYQDITKLNLADDALSKEEQIVENYKANEIPSEINKYDYLQTELNQHYTPFGPPVYDNDVIIRKSVLTNLDTVVDNLDDFYSSVVENDIVKRKRFVIQRYNLGMKRLKTTEISSSKMLVKRHQITPNESASITSFLTLPEPAYHFSHINLPGTNILQKADLHQHYLNYWMFLRAKTSVTIQTVYDVDEPIEHSSETFIDTLKQYVLSDEPDENDDGLQTDFERNNATKERYRKFLEAIVPKTRVVFGLINKYIDGKLSLRDVVNYLEPFMVYHDDLTYKQYTEIVLFISQKITEYKKKFALDARAFQGLYNFKRDKTSPEADIYRVLSKSDDRDRIEELYNNGKSVDNLSSSEIIRQVLHCDQGKLFMTEMAMNDIDLQSMVNLQEEFEKAQEMFEQSLDTEKQSNNCANYVLAKKYLAYDEMVEDNGKPIYFDKKYDTTRYDIISEYAAEAASMDTDDFIGFLASELEKNVGLTKQDARYDAESMAAGKRLVREGQYAVLELEGEGSEPSSLENPSSAFYYYKRVDDQWIKDDSIDGSLFVEQSKLFCNIKENCYNVDNVCSDNKIASLEMKKKSMKDILTEFDDNYSQSKVDLERELQKKTQYLKDTIDTVKLLHYSKEMLYNNTNYLYGISVEDKDIVVSPHTKLRDLILGQSDFVKKQNDIVLFVNRFTRPANDLVGESQYFRYCTDTDTKLLPEFMNYLARTFIENGDYEYALEKTCAEIGTISEDGDAWVDKHSGYVIKYIGFDADEGYDEGGFKVKSREMLASDLGSIFIQQSEGESENISGEKKENKDSNDENDEEKRILLSPESQMVSNIVSTISRETGVLLDAEKSFIISNVIKDLHEQLPDEQDYNRKRDLLFKKKGRKIPEYEIAHSETLLILTLSYTLLSLQSMVPPPKTKKTFPGCIRSFSGYPMEGEADMGGITYIACIANKIKSAVKPWNAIRRSREDGIIKKMKKKLEKIIMKKAIGHKLETAQKYSQLNDNDFIPISHDIKKWNTFLPPLQSFTAENPSFIGNGYKESLEATLKSGKMNQYNDMNMLKGKLFYFSLQFIRKIQGVVSKEGTLLSGANNEPFLENACCSNQDFNVLRYFIGENRSIKEDNERITELDNIVKRIVSSGKANSIFYNMDTKTNYPKIGTKFSEQIIYMAFIHYCKFNRNMPISEDLQRVCINNESGFTSDNTLEEKIEIMKSEGRQYTKEAFQQLLEIVNRTGMIDIQLSNNVFDKKDRLVDVISNLNIKDDEYIPPALLRLIDEIAPTSDELIAEDTEQMRSLKNYLDRANSELEIEIMSFVKKFSDNSKRSIKNLSEFLSSIDQWLPSGDKLSMSVEDETNLKFVEYIRNSIRIVGQVIPNMILHKVENSNITIPKHWNLSDIHEADLRNIIYTNYRSFFKFYDKEEISGVLSKISAIADDMLLLLNEIHSMTADGLTSYDEDLSLEGKENTPDEDKKKKMEKEHKYRALNRTVTGPLFKQFLLLLLHLFIILKDEKDVQLLEKRSTTPSLAVSEMDETTISGTGEVGSIVTTEELESMGQGEITEMDIVEGMQSTINSMIANILSAILKTLDDHKKVINYNHDKIMEKVLYSKEKEKEEITEYLKDLTDEERAVENIIKNSKLERWSKGLQKGLTQYVKGTYDEERDAIEARADLESKLGKSSMVTDMNRDIYMMELNEEQETGVDIEEDALNLDDLPEDDDYGERDGDEGY